VIDYCVNFYKTILNYKNENNKQTTILYIGTLLWLQRDPFLLMLMLLGRHPGLMVPDDVDLNDYEVVIFGPGTWLLEW